jgi:hypothetical protein
MVEQHWSLKPFSGEKLEVPIYEFITGKQTGESFELD